jgi:hypothetical protein
MFYRMRFDGRIGSMLRASGLFANTAEEVRWWPAGSTARWVEWGKSKGLNPTDAACLALGRTVVAKVAEGSMDRDEADQVFGAALGHARQHASPVVHGGVLEIMKELDEPRSEQGSL